MPDGSRRSLPHPYGIRFEAGVFDIKISRVDTDAWPEILNENRFNDPPKAGYKFIMWTIAVENTRGSIDESEVVLESSFELIGSYGILYQTFREENRCGVIPNELFEELYLGGFAEGNVCFAVPGDETNLTMVYEAYHDGPDGKTIAVEEWFKALP